MKNQNKTFEQKLNSAKASCAVENIKFSKETLKFCKQLYDGKIDAKQEVEKLANQYRERT